MNSRVPATISVRLKTDATPTLGNEWERLEKTFGMDGAAFVRHLVREIVAFEREHKRLPRLEGLTIKEAEPASDEQ